MNSDDIATQVRALSGPKRRLFIERLQQQGIAPEDHGLVGYADRTRPIPASSAQRRFWFVQQLLGPNAIYTNPIFVILNGRLDVGALEHAINELRQRHESLRTRFEYLDEELIQIIDPFTPEGLPVEEVESEGALQAICLEEMRRTFDLAAGDLFTARLVRIAPDRHALLLLAHHIVADGWSLDLLKAELVEIYQARVENRSQVLDELVVQYADFAAWEAAQGEGQRRVDELYWRKRLLDAPEQLDLPFDYPRPPAQSYRGGRVDIAFPTELTTALTKLGAANNASLFMVTLAAFYALLARYTGQSDLVVGVPTANRPLPEFEPIIGAFNNYVPLRTRVEPSVTFQDYLRDVRNSVLEDFEHQSIPFEKLIEAVGAKRTLSKHPVFQVLFQVMNAPVRMGKFDLSVEPIAEPHERSQFDLQVQLNLRDGALDGMIEYADDLLHRSTIERFSQHYLRLLEGVCAKPDRPLGEIELLSTPEFLAEIERAQGPSRPIPTTTLHELFEARAAKHPTAPAILQGDASVTFEELNRRANRIARWIVQQRIGEGACVAICADRTPDMVAALLGVLKAGGYYLPLDPQYPSARIASMLADANAAALIADAASVSVAADDARPTLVMDASCELETFACGNLDLPCTPDQLGYLIYTSGSTGQPKGIALKHRGLANNMLDHNEQFGVTPADAIISLSSFSFDMCQYETLGLLLSGAKVVLPELGKARDPEHWVEAMRRHSVTLWNSVPAMFGMLLETCEDLRPEERPHLRLVSLGGDWAPLDMPARARRYFGEDLDVVVLGGATECSVNSTLHWVENLDPAWRSVPYGRPMANQTCYVLSEDYRFAPVGVAGAFYLGGIGLAHGYLNRPGLTAEKFLPDPFAGEPGARMYRTGDVARYRPDGTLELLGREDHQIKVRGFRIEAGDIETALLEHEIVDRAIVTSLREGLSEGVLVAYVTLKPGKNESGDLAQTLKGFLDGRLPSYMVPTHIVALTRMPLSPNGKVDKKALPKPTNARSSGDAAESLSPLEKTIHDVWCSVLGVPQVGRDEDFFEAGGHSLLVIKVQRRLNEVTSYRLKAVDIFTHPTIAGLAQHLQGDGGGLALRSQATVGREATDNRIAVIGMACNVPDASSPDELWSNILAGRESIRQFTREEVLSSGEPAETIDRENYVRAGLVLENVDLFDAEYFGMSETEALLADPQIRMMLELSDRALQQSGWVSEKQSGQVGVFIGKNESHYLLSHLYNNPDVLDVPDSTLWEATNMRDYGASYLSYRLNLSGPSLCVSTGCSTSLVAIDRACRSLLDGECDVAIAGGVNISPRAKADISKPCGYLHRPDGFLSDDGHCRSFSADAGGTIGGSGAGVVILKPLAQAEADGDPIHAVILGSATTTDGTKQPFKVPKVEGQATAAARALERAAVSAETIGYVEAHGMATQFGDPIEVAALTLAFRQTTAATGYCAIGSIKPNIGHMGTASGVVSFIKAVMAVKHGVLPPTLNFTTPNPEIEFDNSPFFVSNQSKPWPEVEGPRRASVNSYGLAAVNAHVVLEEAPRQSASSPVAAGEVLILSGKTKAALEVLIDDVLTSIQEGDLPMDRVATTLRRGRTQHAFRTATSWTAGQSVDEMRQALRAQIQSVPTQPSDTTFAFASHPLDLTWRQALLSIVPAIGEKIDEVDRNLSQARKEIGGGDEPSPDADRLLDTFTTQLAIAEYLLELGVTPSSAFGEGRGLLAGACFAGHLNLGEALKVIDGYVSGQALPLPARLGGGRRSFMLRDGSGRIVEAANIADPGYWRQNLASEIEPVRTKASDSYGGLLVGAVTDVDATAPSPPDLHLQLGRYWAVGGSVDWLAYDAGQGARARVTLPAHPLTKRRFWVPRYPS